MPSMSDLTSAKEFLSNQLLQLGLGGGVVSKQPTISVAAAVASAGRNVHAVGIGRKITDSQTAKEQCVRVYVVQKLPLSLLSPRDVIPEAIDGIPTDVVEAAPPFLFARKKRKVPRKAKPTAPRKKPVKRLPGDASCSQDRRRPQRPVMAGISAGHRDITAGTLGCFCRSTRPSDDPEHVFALSNNHVFANVNSALVGDPLYQPGPADGGGINAFFASLHRFVPIHLGGVRANRVDAAIGTPIQNIAINAEICMIGEINGTASAEDEMPVRKHGRTTGYTEGRVDDVNYTGLVGMDHNDPSVVALFENQIRIVAEGSEPIGLGGDSGSAVIHRTRPHIVGLYFAGPPSGMYGLANRIEDVLTELEITLP